MGYNHHPGQLSLAPSGVAKSSTSFRWGKGGKVTSAGWQVTLCDLIWHVISRSGVVISITNCYIWFTLLYLTLKTQNARFPSKVTLCLNKVCYKVSLCENCLRQSCRAFIVLTIRAKMIGGGCPLKRKFCIKLTRPTTQRRCHAFTNCD